MKNDITRRDALALGVSAAALAAELMTASLPAQLAVVRAVDAGLDRPLAEGLSVEAAEIQELFTHGEAAEGIRAFLEKRKPVYIRR